MARILVDLLSYTGKKGGMEKYTRELYRELGTREPQHEYLGYASKEFMSLDYSWFPGEVVASPYSGENRWIWAFGELFRVSRAAKKLRADLIHSPATLGPWRSSMPAVYTMHDLLYFSLPDLMVNKFYNKPVQWMEKRAASNASRIITDSEASAQDIEKFLGFDRSRVDVIPLAGTPPRRETEVVGNRESDLFLAAGQRIGHKNWGSLIEAISLISPEQRPRLVITGSMGDDPLVPIVEKFNVGDWVELKSWIPDEELAWLYDHATALMQPSFHDGFCLPALEAMYIGLPVLMSDIPVHREVAGDAAGYFDPYDPQTIADSMLKATSDPSWLAELSTRGYEQTARFTWQKVATETLESFDKALKTR